jgi:serine/threonine-protein kinase
MNAGITTALHQIEIGTRHFQFLETRYISPEQILTERATAQSDIYSLGAVLYHLLTGKPPYGGRACQRS